MTALQLGGAGGYGAGTGRAGDGAASQMRDAVHGGTTGLLTLTQRSIGGAGGSGIRSGAGGDASSELAASNEAGGSLSLVSEAVKRLGTDAGGQFQALRRKYQEHGDS